MLTKAAVKARPSVLWCYKKELFLSSHRRKRMQQLKKLAQARSSSFPRSFCRPALLSLTIGRPSFSPRLFANRTQRGLLDPEKEDPFALFVASTSIRYCYYAETQKILGQTFGMLVLQARLSYLPPLSPPSLPASLPPPLSVRTQGGRQHSLDSIYCARRTSRR